MADRQEIAKRVRMALGAADFDRLEDAAAKISAELGYDISREIVRKIKNGTRKAALEELDAIASVCGVEQRFVRGDSYVFVDNQANPGYLNSDILNRSRIDHQLGDCIGCLIDPDFHVTDDWQYRDPIPGQTEIVIDLTEDTFAVAS